MLLSDSSMMSDCCCWFPPALETAGVLLVEFPGASVLRSFVGALPVVPLAVMYSELRNGMSKVSGAPVGSLLVHRSPICRFDATIQRLSLGVCLGIGTFCLKSW